MIGRSGERGSGISVLAARRDDDDIDRYEQTNIDMKKHRVKKKSEIWLSAFITFVLMLP